MFKISYVDAGKPGKDKVEHWNFNKIDLIIHLSRDPTSKFIKIYIPAMALSLFQASIFFVEDF